ncbi:MAG: hypothetical protein R2681_02305 [Pyrinomonadaceae bacterium]
MTIDNTIFTLELMYRRPKFLELLLEIREQLAREVDYDVELFAETVRSGNFPGETGKFELDDRSSAKRSSKKKQKKKTGI